MTRCAITCVTASAAASIVLERRAQRDARGRLRYQAKHDPRDDRQRSLGSDEQMREVVADDVLHDLAAGLDDDRRSAARLARPSTYCFVVPYLNARGPPAHSATLPPIDGLIQRRRIGRIEQPDAFDRLLELPRDHVGLDDGDEVRLVDLEDAVHPLQRDDDAAAHRDAAARVARAAAARHERHASARDTGERRRRPDRRRPERRRRRADAPALQRVGAVRRDRRLVGANVVGADDGAQRVEQIRGKRHGRASASRGIPGCAAIRAPVLSSTSRRRCAGSPARRTLHRASAPRARR